MKREFDTRVLVTRMLRPGFATKEHIAADLPDADIRDLSDRLGVQHAMLRVPSIDEETGTEFDVDGDRSYDRREMIVCAKRNGGDCRFTYEGFVNLEEDFGKPPRWVWEEWHMAIWNPEIWNPEVDENDE